MPYSIANTQPNALMVCAADQFYNPPSPRIGAWAREQASFVTRPRIRVPFQRQPSLSIEQAALVWRQKRQALEALISPSVPAEPTRLPPPPPPAAPQVVPTVHITPAAPKRPPPPVPGAPQATGSLPRVPSPAWSMNSYEKMLFEDTDELPWLPKQSEFKAANVPLMSPLTRTSSEQSEALEQSRARSASFFGASLVISSPSSGAQSDWSAAHTDDGKPGVIVGDRIVVEGESYPLRYGRRGIVTYYHPIRMRQILVRLGEI